MEGFKPLLKDASMNYGAVDEPAEATVEVTFEDGTSKTVDAVGIDEQAGETIITGFDWVDPEKEALKNIAEGLGVSAEEVRKELEPPIMMIRFSAPYDRVMYTDIDSGGLL